MEIVLAVMVVLSVVIVGWLTLAQAGDPPAPGKAAPEFGLTGIDGAPLRLADLRGTRAAIVFLYRHVLEQEIEWMDGSRFTFVYDGQDRVSSLINQNGERSTLVWNEQGRRTGLIDAQGHRLTYAYDSHGQMESLTDALGNTVTRGMTTYR